MTLIDVDSGAEAGLADKSDLDNLKPNSGVRGVIAGVLVQFQLSDPGPERRLQALTALERDPEASHLSILRGAIESETDPAIKARKERLQRLLTIQFGSDQANRVAAIESFAGDPGVDARAALNPLLATRVEVFDAAPEGLNVARLLTHISGTVGFYQVADLALDGCRWPRSISWPPSGLPSPSG
jgi:urea transport system permease protein